MFLFGKLPIINNTCKRGLIGIILPNIPVNKEIKNTKSKICDLTGIKQKQVEIQKITNPISGKNITKYDKKILKQINKDFFQKNDK